MHFLNLLSMITIATLVSGQEISFNSGSIPTSSLPDSLINSVTTTSPSAVTSSTPRGIPSQTYTKISVNRVATQSPTSTAVTNEAVNFVPGPIHVFIIAALVSLI
ncbi:hypothetical protein K7432_006718 [Basidiobolus ranarum]|uniref:Uncharacterized protein n=1 Tax=Basidiobolus ranarum TaxID=34480 RepID=A0ABR2W1M3_9FUNG